MNICCCFSLAVCCVFLKATQILPQGTLHYHKGQRPNVLSRWHLCVSEAPHFARVCVKTDPRLCPYCACERERACERSRRAPARGAPGTPVINCWQPAVITDLCSDSFRHHIWGAEIKQQIVFNLPLRHIRWRDCRIWSSQKSAQRNEY